MGRAISQILLQGRIISAVARREIQLKAAKGLFGVAGVFFEPLALIGTFLLLRVLIRGAGEGDYINPVLWLASGFVPFFMFTEVAIKALGGVEKGGDLYFYRRLRPLDSLMGNALLSSQIFATLMLLFILGVSAWEWQLAVAVPGFAIFIYLGFSLLGFGVGLSTLILGHRLPILAWIVKTFLRRFLLWTSCIFFPIRVIPDEFRHWILWNPLAHGVELFRQSLNPYYPAPDVSALYFWSWVVGSIGFGLLIYGNNEELLYLSEQLSDADKVIDAD
ncbi:ABC transporter permease [Cyanobium sp. ATX 6A2]|uniref:ABC transporter permease n=1 Tax=Cyanobium sp. ATX 6A2 TaxID=2823700 RepID=UPI0020CCCB5B|nr:hypothetical protein [Cyanobium sp. ATX 6A2]MCP9889254.1 ABC transporter permease [Cyanobium sp. ATX 6A2]